jgi:hypothetical protein
VAQLVDSSQYHVLSPRAMENFRDAGIADKGDAKDAAAQNMQATAWYAGLAGPHDGHGREIGRLEAWGGATPTRLHRGDRYTTRTIVAGRSDELLDLVTTNIVRGLD